MSNADWLHQNPPPGKRLLRFRGDTLDITLTLDRNYPGHAWLRTNIGYGRITRKEIIAEVHHDAPRLGRDWFDTPMVRVDDRSFKISLPLTEVGHYEAKAYFLGRDRSRPRWPAGENTIVNVEPADTCCANSIYNAFIRQFGPNKSGDFTSPLPEEQIAQLDRAHYTVIPPSGKFRDLIAELDFLVGTLGCRLLQLLPIHPTPTTYGRMGRFGSPYASLSFTDVDPALADFDTSATPLEQFLELVDAVHARNAKLLIDIAINHTGWAANLHESHPHWLSRHEDGNIEVPGAWGVRWEDLTKLDYRHRDLWRYMADVFLTWCRRGVDGFRCDAGYMIPEAAWTYILARVRAQFPETIFLLEGLGGKLSVTRNLLNRSNFNWAYSELFQNYDRGQIETYLPRVIEISESDGIMVHFSETHDNPRLAARSPVYARMRTALCALVSSQGGFGFANGVEWLATEKIDVHRACSLNWGAADNQVAWIQRLNAVLRTHPAFGDRCRLKPLQQGPGNCLVVLRDHSDSGKQLLVLVNLDDRNPVTALWNHAESRLSETNLTDLLSEVPIHPADAGGLRQMPLEPGQVLCLTDDPGDLEMVRHVSRKLLQPPHRALHQRYRAKTLEVFRQYHGAGNLGDFDVDAAVEALKADPRQLCRELNPDNDAPFVIEWVYPHDVRREVMVPPDHFLLVRCRNPFSAVIQSRDRTDGCEKSLPYASGGHFALFAPLKPTVVHEQRQLKVRVFGEPEVTRAEATLLYLSRPENVRIQRVFRRPELLHGDYRFLGTNGRGAMLRAGVDWGGLQSRYDALLAANLSSAVPEDRRIAFTRCRVWVVFQGYSQEIGNNCLETFRFQYSARAGWQFQVPTGQGESIRLTIEAEMPSGENAVRLHFYRHSAGREPGLLADQKPVRLILRPDIEWRSFHETTKAYQGPEHLWPQTLRAESRGFEFKPQSEFTLTARISTGEFVLEPEWQYMVHRTLEAERGLDPASDLFSPGYFSLFLNGGGSEILEARVASRAAVVEPGSPPRILPEIPLSWEPAEAMNAALDHYVVRRGELHTVIAGYPWFLDWGRDALIFVRGLIASGRTEPARSILKQFGRFEEGGTIPNMIQGTDAGNRDTSDAPLWFFVACEELLAAESSDEFLDEVWNGRSLRQILRSIGGHLLRGTANGIHVDPESGLLFSPAHFTWMDTNFPAGTPREGYPVEIQALWCSALRFLTRIDSENPRWAALARQVRQMLLDLYYRPSEGFLADCLHAAAGTPASKAEADDALRPNQLLALTLGALDDAERARRIVGTCEELLVPGAIRSLADRPLARPLPILHRGRLLNDPLRPYQGRYLGDEDTARKPAYHNGTAWTWLFPTFCEAYADVYGRPGVRTALAWLGSSSIVINRGCVGNVPEILDGDAPHTPRGCDSQAWGASEFLRVWLKLHTRLYPSFSSVQSLR
ncbi:MAG TPA: amylo-alpha-1,6-glucosidase [Desulfobacterales bacterium]